ncbi:hypothetical protein FH972_002874 [Carpinus fangiana]|uniref:Uncharacterized protein n=1 Tax=Carpinus fangiana TaxID=176857 RepID=A0A5N6QG77_9ROSI|nr:hypothetical protein FH972_002874 [Carpinus fangiana]
MGGCATKPKVLKDAPAPEPTKEDKPSAAPEPPVVVVVGVTEGEKIDAKAVEESDDKVKEIVDDDKLDDQDSKRRSLSILFKENEEGKGKTGDGNPAVEPPKQEEPPENIKPTYESETTVLEVEKTEILVEQTVPDVVDAQKPEIPVQQTPAPDVVDAPVQQTPVSEVVYASEKVETEKTTETAPTVDDEKKKEVPDVADGHVKAEIERAVEAAPAEEMTLDKKKTEAPDVGSAKEEAEAQKVIEVALVTETQNYGTSEEKKTEAKDAAGEKASV